LLEETYQPALEQLTRLAKRLLDAPFAMISLVDATRQVHRCQIGELSEHWQVGEELPISQSFCRYAVESRQPLIINNAREHPLVRDNPLTRELGLSAYAGIPLATPDGHVIGTLCVLDSRTRDWSHEQIETLRSIAAAAMAVIADQGELKTSETRPETDDAQHGHEGGTLEEAGVALLRAATAFTEGLDAYDACLQAPTGDPALLAKEADARAKVVDSEAGLQAARQRLAAASGQGRAGLSDERLWLITELGRTTDEYFAAKKLREDAVQQFQRGEAGIDDVDRRVLQASNAEQSLRLAARAYALEQGE
jgi:GAF domain-containing protein